MREKRELEETIKQTRRKLDDAEMDVRRAIMVVESERSRSVVIEPSALEELERAKRMIRVAPPKERRQYTPPFAT